MKNDQTRASIPPIGATSLLTVFAVLALTVFALLTLSDVRADARLAEASRASTAAYYAADAQAQETLARIRAGEVPENVSKTGDVYTFAQPISDTLELQVEVAVDPDGTYEVYRWQAVSTQDWPDEFDLPVWTGD